MIQEARKYQVIFPVREGSAKVVAGEGESVGKIIFNILVVFCQLAFCTYVAKMLFISLYYCRPRPKFVKALNVRAIVIVGNAAAYAVYITYAFAKYTGFFFSRILLVVVSVLGKMF